MNTRLLNIEVRNFLVENEHKSVADIVLKGSPFSYISTQELAQQFVGFKKSKKKLPTWYANLKVLFPPSLNIEQTSSEQTALYKSKLVSGNLLIDCTGGFGVDSFYFSKIIKQVVHCDLNGDLQKLVKHNFKNLNCDNIKSIHTDGIQEFLNTSEVDWLYIDPSRRSETKGKVFFLKDCLPSVPDIQQKCFEKTNAILVKTAPILDISAGLSELTNVKEIHIVAVNNEVKELLWILKKDYDLEPTILAINIGKNKIDKIQLPLSAESKSSCSLGSVSQYLYEPYAAVLKTGAFNWLSEQYNVSKIHLNSHLYTTDKLTYFPGKSFKVNQTLLYNKKTIKQFIGLRLNIVTRNFKISVVTLKKKHKFKEGDNRFLFFTTNSLNQQIIIDCDKLS